MISPKLTKLPPISEVAFQAQILQAARTFGWLRYHTRYSIGSMSGYPDLTLVKPPRVLSRLVATVVAAERPGRGGCDPDAAKIPRAF